MSRTKKGKKGTGFEYWTKRPGNRHGGGLGPKDKNLTIRKERAQSKQDLIDAPLEPEYDEREYIPPEEE